MLLSSMRFLGTLGLLAGIAAALAVGTNTLRPHPLPWVRPPLIDDESEGENGGPTTNRADRVRIDLETFLGYLNGPEPVHVIDARKRSDYEKGHVPLARSLPADEVREDPTPLMDFLDEIGPDELVIVYCTGSVEECYESTDIYKLLKENNHNKAKIFDGGFPAWKAAGHDVVTGPNP